LNTVSFAAAPRAFLI